MHVKNAKPKVCCLSEVCCHIWTNWPLLAVSEEYLKPNYQNLVGWYQQWDIDMQQQALRVAPVLGLYESHLTPGWWWQLSIHPPIELLHFFPLFILLGIFSVQDISFSVQNIKAIAGFHFHTLTSNPGSYWQQAPSPHNSPPTSVRKEMWKRPITFWREENYLLIIEFSEHGVRY